MTTENWKDHIKFFSYDEEVVHKDAFGHRISILSTYIKMSFSFVACSGSEATSGSNNKVEENREFQRETTEEGYIIISKEEFASYITKVELTTQNWKQYMDIVKKTFVRKNKFGEVISTVTFSSLTAKNALACFFDDFAMELIINGTGKNIYCEDTVGQIGTVNASIEWGDYVIEDFVCERITGALYMLEDIPGEYISTEESGTEFICIGSSDNYTRHELEYLGMDLVKAYNNFVKNEK